MVSLQNAEIAQRGRVILTGVDLKLAAGEFAYLIGRTGSGKSSLLKTLYAHLPLHAGTGIVAGFDLAQMTRRSIPQLRRKLGIVFQDFNLLTDRNVSANLDFVLRATGHTNRTTNRLRIEEMLEAVDLARYAEVMPFSLSGGEQQRVVLARALLNNPQLILADEPTGNLDPETSDEIMLLLRRLAKERNVAVLFATHDYRILEQHPARILRVRRGGVHEDRG